MGLVLALFPGRFFHVMEVSLTLVSYTHFILVYIWMYVVPPMVMVIGQWQ